MITNLIHRQNPLVIKARHGLGFAPEALTPLGGYPDDEDKARELFGIPERFKTLAMMAVGYQLPEDQLPEQFKAKELAPRKRKPLGEQFFLGGWGAGI